MKQGNGNYKKNMTLCNFETKVKMKTKVKNMIFFYVYLHISKDEYKVGELTLYVFHM